MKRIKKNQLMYVGDVEVQRKNSILASNTTWTYYNTAMHQILDEVYDNSLVIIYNEPGDEINGDYLGEFKILTQKNIEKKCGIIFVSTPEEFNKIGNEILSGKNRKIWIFIDRIDKLPVLSTLIPLHKAGIKFFVSVKTSETLTDSYGQCGVDYINSNFTKLNFHDEKDEEKTIAYNIAEADMQEVGWGEVLTNFKIFRP